MLFLGFEEEWTSVTNKHWTIIGEGFLGFV